MQQPHQSYVLKNNDFRITLWPNSSRKDQLEYQVGGKRFSLGELQYHVKYWCEAAGNPRVVHCSQIELLPKGLRRYEEIKGLGRFSIEYRMMKKNGPLSIVCRFDCTADRPVQLGMFFLGMKPPERSTAIRMIPGAYCGYTSKTQTILWQFHYDDRKGLSQMATAIDQQSIPQGTTRTRYQYLVLSFPPAYRDGVVQINPGASIVGQYTVERRKEHIWDPALKREELESLKNPIALLKPRFSYRRYVANWERYIQDPDLWVPLGERMGLFHVGFYGMLTRWRTGGPYGYELNGRPVRYKAVHDIIYGRHRGQNIRLKGYQENKHMCEIAWGNGGNSMVAYALYHHGKSWAISFADRMINAMLGLEGRGFLIPEGPLKDAWIGGYEAVKKCFQDHYGGQQVFIPDQGFVNYFLGRCYIEGFNKDPRIIEAIRRNCEEFLLPLEKRLGTFLNALSPDGSSGYSREGYRYQRAVAPGLALAALSFVVLYELTGQASHLRTAERIFIERLAPLITACDFGFMEYDHNERDSAGACMMLIALAEYLDQKAALRTKQIRDLQRKVFYYLMSFRHEHDYFLYRHSRNVLGWGGIAINKYGFVHGFTRGSSQGTYCLHIRWEYGYALLRTAQTVGHQDQQLAHSALMNYLNYITYQQFINPKLAKGYGGVTEHTALSTYVQDTTHLIHSTPLAMILLEKHHVDTADALR